LEPVTSSPESLHPAREQELLALAERLGHRFADLGLLERALCHSSTGNEGRVSYERLEFLGDAILGFLVADVLFHTKPEIPEGELTDRRAQIVSRQPLARVGEALELSRYLIGGRGLRDQDRRSRRILADLVESVVAAIYLDGGVRAARAFLKRHVLPHAGTGTSGPALRDPKSRLLHYAQVRDMGQPRYELEDAWGPDHAREFQVAVYLQGTRIATGSGRTKQAAEKRAAAQALEQLQSEAAPAAEEQPSG
jgi:ribonuclease-3